MMKQLNETKGENLENKNPIDTQANTNKRLTEINKTIQDQRTKFNKEIDT